MMNKTLFAMMIAVVFLGCQADRSPETEIIFSNLGKNSIENLWISIEGTKTVIGTIQSGEQKSILLNPVGNKKIDYGFKGDEALRSRMDGELFFFGNQIPMKSGILEVGFEDGLIRRLRSKQKG